MIKVIDKMGNERVSFPNEKSAARYTFNKHNEKLRPKDIFNGANVYVKQRVVIPEKRITKVSLIPCVVTFTD